MNNPVLPAKTLAKQIELMPKSALPSLLTTLVKKCIEEKVFGDKKISDVIRTVETSLTGATSFGQSSSEQNS